MQRIPIYPNPNRTEYGTFSEIQNLSDTENPIASDSKFLFWSIVDVTAEVRLNNSTLIDGDLLCFLYFFENYHNYFICSLLIRLQLLNFK